MALMETLREDWVFGGIDNGKWSTWGSTATIAGTNLLLELTSTLAANYGGLTSLATYDLTGSYAFSQLVDAGNQALTSLEVYPLELTTGTNALAIMVNVNTVYARKKLAGSYTTVGSTVAYNSTTMKWFRIRESGGTTFWDYAADPSSTWTNIASVANPITVTALVGGVTIGTWQTEGSQSTVKVNNFNCVTGANQFVWQGQTWNKRIHQANVTGQTWSDANISGPNGSDYLTLTLSNPGSAPVGCEVFSVQRGFGYGTYTSVIATQLNNISLPIGFGGMFTFDFTAPPDYREIDMHETRPYNGLLTTQILYNHAYNSAGSAAWVTNNVTQASDTIQTHQCIWLPNTIIFRTYSGEGTGGTLLNYFEHKSNIQQKGLERVHFNVFVDPTVTGYATVTPLSIVIRKFSFAPHSYPSPIYSMQGYQ